MMRISDKAMTLMTKRERTADMPNRTLLQDAALFLQINATRSALGLSRRGNKGSINRAENVRGAENLRHSTRRKDTTKRDMPMVEELTVQITMNCAKIATRKSTSQIRRQEL